MTVTKLGKRGQYEIKYPEERVLLELYRTRGLTKDQIAKAMLAGPTYIVSYLTRLQKQGLVSGKILSRDKKRVAKLYQITDKGIELLENNGLVKRYENLAGEKKSVSYEQMIQTGVYIPRKVLAYDNNQVADKDKMMFTLYTNELYAGLTEYGFYFYDSREWKLKYQLNRNTMMRGGLRTEDGVDYSLYVLFTAAEVKIASMSEKMLYRMMHEMTEFPQSNRHIIYVYGGQAEYDAVLRFFKQNPVPCEELLIVPHGFNGIGLNIIRLLQNQEGYKDHISSHLGTPLNSEILKDETINLFADYVIELNGRSFYLIDNIKLNEAKLSMLTHIYTPDKFKRTGIPVMILCWDAMGAAIEAEFSIYPYIELIEMDIVEDLNTWIEKIEKKKLYLQWQD